MEPSIGVRDIDNLNNIIKIKIEDFTTFHVNINTLEDSNIFLNNLWEMFDLNISEDHLNRCPWYYVPNKITLKNKNITFFGSIRTVYGYIYSYFL